MKEETGRAIREIWGEPSLPLNSACICHIRGGLEVGVEVTIRSWEGGVIRRRLEASEAK